MSTLIAVIVLGVSLLVIGFLFVLRAWEQRQGHIFFPYMRITADTQALKLRAFMFYLGDCIAMIPPMTVVLARFGVHQAALGAARLSRELEAGAHRLADRVSHRHRFERKETRSQFLKEVSEVKQNGASSEETTSSV